VASGVAAAALAGEEEGRHVDMRLVERGGTGDAAKPGGQREGDVAGAGASRLDDAAEVRRGG